MSSVNKVILVGRLGKDPEVRYTTDGSAIANISLATSSKWKDKNTGEAKEDTEWHRISFFGKLAEVVGEYVQKGGLIYVEGRLKTRKWTDKEGIERYVTEIIADNMQMLGSKQESSSGGGQQEPQRSQSNGNQQRSTGQANTNNRHPQQRPQNNVADLDDDIPF